MQQWALRARRPLGLGVTCDLWFWFSRCQLESHTTSLASPGAGCVSLCRCVSEGVACGRRAAARTRLLPAGGSATVLCPLPAATPQELLQRPVSDSNSEIPSQLVRGGLGVGIFNSLVLLICFRSL